MGHPHWVVQVPRLRGTNTYSYTYRYSCSNSNSNSNRYRNVYSYSDGNSDVHSNADTGGQSDATTLQKNYDLIMQAGRALAEAVALPPVALPPIALEAGQGVASLQPENERR